ncbi:hypothetical protein F7725_019723 [Dissostichus mawsoni]|uniref:ZP domain-containing protein n=1 Tax=Dissostichus mawsoni TaxID=36200 RepID=A0A7J5YKJ4_DISMA|nr:hypothetical protein F7725_019723 [Dissostichus mawsoni]
MGVTIYTLHLTFGFLVLPKHAPFTATAYLRAKLEDIGLYPWIRGIHNKTQLFQTPPSAAPPSVSGSCDDKNFYVLVKYGTKGFNFQTIMGKRVLTGSLAQQYGLMGNDTHFSLIVPFSAADATVEAVESSSIKSRLDVTLRYPKTNKNIQDFSLACNFVTKLIECFPNGTITAMAITLESVPSLNPRRLTLRNPACGPTYSNDQYAYFVFTANSCGTTRKFLPNMMLYENEISITDELELRKLAQSKEPEFDLKVFCYYDINTNQAMGFNTRPRRSEPYADDARGEMQVEMRVALDDSYSVFHRVEDNPITKYLQQPLYFEVELMGSYNPKVSIELAYCWATLEEDKMSLPRWDLLVNGCANSRDPHPVIFHSVLPKGRVNDPSNVKRFAVPMFAFAEDKDNLNRQVFVHCEVVICDVRNPVDAACNVQCSDQDNTMKGQKLAVSDDPGFKSTGLHTQACSITSSGSNVLHLCVVISAEQEPPSSSTTSFKKWFILLVAVVNIEAQHKPPIKINSKCLGNLLRVDVSRLGGRFLEVSVVINNSSIILKPSLSSKCGFTIKKDHLGNAVIYASIQNCFAQNVVSVKKAAPTDYNLPAYPDSDPRKAAEKHLVCNVLIFASQQPMDAGFRITTVVFFTPEERVMQVDEAREMVMGSQALLPGWFCEAQILHIVYIKIRRINHLFSQNVLRISLFPKRGVYFTETSIRWFLPRRIDPLIYSKHFRLLEVNMGVDGRKLEATEEMMFKALIGPVGFDVMLKNISSPSEVLSLADCIAEALKS